MIGDEERKAIVEASIQFLAGDQSEDAEDAYYDMLYHHDAELTWLFLDEIATRSSGVLDAMTLGIGPLMSFIIHYGSSHPELIAAGIARNARLQQALRHVRGVRNHPALVALLPETLSYES